MAIAATDANKLEGSSGFTPFTFTVTRSGNLSGTAAVDYLVAGNGGNPADSDDFGGILPSSTVMFAANESSKLISINVSGDNQVEAGESFTVTLANPISAAITTATATGTILNDDRFIYSIERSQVSVVEGNSGITPVTFTITRSGIGSVSAVDYAFTGTATLGSDFTIDNAPLAPLPLLPMILVRSSRSILLAISCRNPTN